MKIVYNFKKDSPENGAFDITESDLLVSTVFSTYESAISLLNKIENERVNGERVSHLFKHADFSFWWFIHPTIFPSIKEITSFIDEFESFVGEKKPDIIRVEANFDRLDLIEQICKKNKIKFEYAKMKYYRYQITEKMKRVIQAYRFRRISSKKIKKRFELFKKKYKSIPSLEGKIVFAIPTSYRRDVYDSTKGNFARGEYIQGPIMDFLKQMNFDVIGMDIDYAFKGDLHVLQERLDDSIFWFPLEYILMKNPIQEKEGFLKKYRNIISDSNFRSLFSYKRINFWNQIEYDFIKLSFFSYIPHYIKMLSSLTQFFMKNKPKCVFIPYESGPFGLLVIIACKRNGIRTIGIQHGIIWENHPDYSHKDFRSPENLWGMPLPDYMLLFGDFPRRKLIENQRYPKEKLVVFGNAAFFDFEAILEKLKLLDCKTKYDIPKNKKIILFTTLKYQGYYSAAGKQNYDELVLKKLLELYSNKKEYFVILKPHPSHQYTGFYEKLIKKFNAENFIILQGDLFELLFISDVHISTFSTTLLDSIALGKMTIRVDFGESFFPFPFDEYNVLVTSSLESLFETIERLMTDDNFQKQLLKNRYRFMKDQYNVPSKDPFEKLKLVLD